MISPSFPKTHLFRSFSQMFPCKLGISEPFSRDFPMISPSPMSFVGKLGVCTAEAMEHITSGDAMWGITGNLPFLGHKHDSNDRYNDNGYPPLLSWYNDLLSMV